MPGYWKTEQGFVDVNFCSTVISFDMVGKEEHGFYSKSGKIKNGWDKKIKIKVVSK